MRLTIVAAGAGREPARRAAAIPDAQRPARAAAVHDAPRRGRRARSTSASTCSRRPVCCRCRSGRRSGRWSSTRSRTRTTRCRRSTSRACPGSSSPGTCIVRSATVRSRPILSPHGHWTYGRLENTAINSGPGRAIGLARQGFVVFTHDMVGYGDSRQLTHTFGGRRENLWGLSLGGLQLWNAHPRARFPRDAALRPPRRLRRHRGVGRRHADVPARRRSIRAWRWRRRST